MLEWYVNKKFREESLELKTRAARFHYYQTVNPDEFIETTKGNKITFANNPYKKTFNLIAN